MSTVTGSRLSGVERQIDRLVRKVSGISVATRILIEYAISSDRSREAGLPDFGNAARLVLSVVIALAIVGLVRGC